MYQDFFRLNRQPFSNTPDTEVFYTGALRAEVLNALLYAIQHGEALLKVVGEVGCGKTMLCRMLESRLTPHVDVLYLANPNLTPDNILHALALEMGIDAATNANKVHLQHQVHAHLLERHAQQRRVVLLVEEAQCMPLATLEEIRMLSNLETREQKLLQIVLFGQPELESKLAQRDARQLTERIAYSFYLAPFSSKEVRDYVIFRLTQRSDSKLPELFSPASLRLLTWASNGLARRINFIADKALLAAFSDRAASVTLSHVLRAVKDCDFGARWLKRRSQALMLVSGLILMAGAIAQQEQFTNNFSWRTDIGLESLELPSANLTRVLPPKEEMLSLSHLHAMPAAPVAVGVASTSATDEMREMITRTNAGLTSPYRGRYTLQVMTSRLHRSTELNGLEALIKSPDIARWKNQLLLHEGQLKGERIIVVSVGNYASYAEARRAAEVMPAALKLHQPLTRTIDSLRREVEATP